MYRSIDPPAVGVFRNAGKRAAEREVFDGARVSFLGYFFGQAKKYF